jgi:hypothetical protein
MDSWATDMMVVQMQIVVQITLHLLRLLTLVRAELP